MQNRYAPGALRFAANKVSLYWLLDSLFFFTDT
jgi:hypothetical protein